MNNSPDTDTIRYGPCRRGRSVSSVGPPFCGQGRIICRSALFELLGEPGALPGVGASRERKTFLLRSWIGAAGLAESTAWVSVQREERNPQRFWVSVLSALRQTAAVLPWCAFDRGA